MNKEKKKPSRKAKPSKALSKEQLVKLYEEFKKERKQKHQKEMDNSMANDWYAFLYCINKYERFGFIRVATLRNVLDVRANNRPTYTEPTFNEFMESLKEKKTYSGYLIGSPYPCWYYESIDVKTN